MKNYLCAVLMVVAGAAQAVELQLPVSARQMIARDTVDDRFLVPVAPFANGALPTQMIEGTVARSAWRIDVAGLTPLQLINPLRDQLVEAGYRVVLDCAAQECGGYDFRFATEVLPAPNMYVNIRNFHVITAVRDADGVMEEVATILTSASSGASFVQIIQAGTENSAIAAVADVPAGAKTPPSADLSRELSQNGHVVLDGIEFESGTSELGQGPFSILEELAQVMGAHPDMRIAVVGHTDNVGSLEANTDLSVSRADAVRGVLIDRYNIAPLRIEVQGAGYLSPVTANTSEAGRETNRRVEAVVLSN